MTGVAYRPTRQAAPAPKQAAKATSSPTVRAEAVRTADEARQATVHEAEAKRAVEVATAEVKHLQERIAKTEA
jgi:hypothetical protein